MPDKNRQSYTQGTELDLGDYLKAVDSLNAQSPYLGLADQALQPNEDPQYGERLKRSSRINAWGDVLSSIFDSAVAASGGLVGKNGQNQYQLRNLEDYNRERARVLGEKRQLQVAQLQDIVNNARFNIDSQRAKDSAKLQGALAKAKSEFYSRENIRQQSQAADINKQQADARYAHEQQLQDKRSAADRYQSDMMYNRYRDYPSGSRTQSVGLELNDSTGNLYKISNAQIPQMYAYIKKNLGSIADESIRKQVAFDEKFDRGKIDLQYQKDVISSVFEDPSVNQEFVRLATRGDGTPAGNMVMQNAANTTPEKKAGNPQELVAPLVNKARAIIGSKSDSKLKKAELIKLINQQYPDMDNASKAQIYQMLVKNAQ